MAVGAEHMAALVRRIVAEAIDERDAGAENVSDWSRIFDQGEVNMVVRLLATMASIEQDKRVREAQLHAILEISSWMEVGKDLLHPLRGLNPGILDAEQLDYLDTLGIQLED